MKLFTSLLSATLLASLAFAETHFIDFNVTWAWLNVDGVKSRPVITNNGEFPWPTIRITKGDRVYLSVTNSLGNDTTSIHFHGIFQHNTTYFDGAPGVGQCGISPGDTMVYNFTVPDQAGTYWYHSHSSGQYMDGLRGIFIIEDPDVPYDYDEEVVLTISDWYHDTLAVLNADFLNIYNPTGAEPVPQNLLWNDTMNGTWHVQPDTTYLLRIINIGGFVSQYIWMEDHEFEIVAVDGIYVERNTTDLLYLTAAQRYDVLIHTKNETDRNYAFMQKFDDSMLDLMPSDLLLNDTNWIVYNDDADFPDQYDIDSLDDYFDDFYLVPLEKVDLYDDPDITLKLDVVMDNLDNGINYAFFNKVTYTAPIVPAIGTVLSAGDLADDPTIYGSNTNSYVVKKNEVVELIVNNNDTGKHPFHLHGHIFQVIERGPDYTDAPGNVNWNESAEHILPDYPSMRDTTYLLPQSWIRIRFVASNPGVWFFHCHVDWHLIQGLAIILIEAPDEIQKFQTLPENWIQVCENSNTPYVGNAANNTEDFLDLTGELVQVKSLPAGFTARGIVALVFSCVAGVLGIIMIGVYGMAEIPDIERKVFANLDVESSVLLADTDDEEEEGGDSKEVHEMTNLSKDHSGSKAGSSSDSH